MDINEQLKTIRKNKNITQQQVADYIGINQKTYSDIEKGIIRLTVNDFLKICKFLEIDPVNIIQEDQILVSLSKCEIETFDKIYQRIHKIMDSRK